MNEEIKETAEKFKPVYFAIAEDIAKDIEEGLYLPGDKIPSAKQLSLQYRVHKNSVSPAFQVLKNAKLLEVVNGVGMVVAERPDPKSTVAVIIPKNSFNSGELLDGIRETCSQNETKVKLITYSSVHEQDEIIMGLSGSSYKGAVLHQRFSEESCDELIRLKKASFPVVLLGRPDQIDTGLWQIERRELHAGHMAAEHLIEQRYSRIGIVISKYSYDGAFLNGYSQAMREYDTPVNDKYVQLTDDEDACGDATRELLSIEKRPVKAIIYAHPEDAVAGIEVMKARGITPGKQMGVVCFGDFPGSEAYSPPITVIRHDFQEIGQKAAQLIFVFLRSEYKRDRFNFDNASVQLLPRESSMKDLKEPVCLSELQKLKRGLIMDRQARIDRYWRDVHNPGWWKTVPGGWEMEELYYRNLYNAW